MGDAGCVELETLAGNQVRVMATDAGVMVNDSTVIQADIIGEGGVIHGIDTVILPGSFVPCPVPVQPVPVEPVPGSMSASSMSASKKSGGKGGKAGAKKTGSMAGKAGAKKSGSMAGKAGAKKPGSMAGKSGAGGKRTRA